MQSTKKPSWIARVAHQGFVLVGAAGLTLAFFLVLPLIQAITRPPERDVFLQDFATATVPPPPPPPEQEPEPEPEPEEPPPQLAEENPLLDLAQLELALNPTIGEGLLAGDFAMKLTTAVASGEDVDALFSLADLDQEPRKLHTPPPAMNAQMRKRAPATVVVLFTVDERGRVAEAIAQEPADPLFAKAALAAVKQWRFEPGKSNGRPVQFRMRLPITFPKKQ